MQVILEVFQKHRKDILISLFIFLFFSGVYFITRSNFLTYDSVDYSDTIVNMNLKRQLHPHHLLYSPLLNFIEEHFFVDAEKAAKLRYFQNINIVFSGIALALFYFLIRKFTESRMYAFLLMSITATSYIFWFLASQVEVYNITHIFITLTLLNVLKHDKYRWYNYLLGGISYYLAMMFHQTAIFMGVLTFSYIAMSNKNEIKTKIKDVSVFLGIPLILVGITYAWASWFVIGKLSIAKILFFATSYAHTGKWGGFHINQIYEGFFSFWGSFPDLMLFLPFLEKMLFLAFPALFAIVGLICLGLYFFYKKRVKNHVHTPENRVFVWGLVLWVIVQTIFYTYWDPTNREFWMGLMTPLTLIAVFYYSKINKLGYVILSSYLVFQIGVNTYSDFKFCLSKNNYLDMCSELEHKVQPNDLYISIDFYKKIYMSYFRTNNNVVIHDLCSFNPATPGNTKDIIDTLTLKMGYAFKKNQKVFVDSDVLFSSYDYVGLPKYVDEQMIKNYFRRFGYERTNSKKKFTVYRVYKKDNN